MSSSHRTPSRHDRERGMALAIANQLNNGQNHPSKLVINSMVDCAEVAPGTNNC